MTITKIPYVAQRSGRRAARTVGYATSASSLEMMPQSLEDFIRSNLAGFGVETGVVNHG